MSTERGGDHRPVNGANGHGIRALKLVPLREKPARTLSSSRRKKRFWMSQRCVGFVVVGDAVTVVDTEVPDKATHPVKARALTTGSIRFVDTHGVTPRGRGKHEEHIRALH
jgi:hypothetical protein